MRARFMLPCLALAFAPFALAAPPEPVPVPSITVAPSAGKPVKIGDPVRLKGPEFELLILNGTTGPVTWDITSPDGTAPPVKWFECKPEQSIIGIRAGHDGPDQHMTPKSPSVAVFGSGVGRAVITAWGVVDGKPVKLAQMLVDANTAPIPPPKPDPKPDPDPIPPPKPLPVTSFRVIFVFESGATLTAAQHSVIYGKTVADFLNAKTTKEGNWAGWNRFDKDVTGETLPAGLRALWSAIKPQLTAVPCVAVEVNGKVDIISLPATPTEAVALFTKYAEGK